MKKYLFIGVFVIALLIGGGAVWFVWDASESGIAPESTVEHVLEPKQAEKKETTESKDICHEGEQCKTGSVCAEGLILRDGFCIPDIQYTEIVEPQEEKDLYEVAEGGPYNNDYLLHIDRLVINEELYVWIGNAAKPHWFKARREKELRPYELKLRAGKNFRIKLRNQSRVFPAEFRGKIYLTKPDKPFKRKSP